MDPEEHNRIPSWYGEIFPAGPHVGWYHKFGDHAASFVERSTDQLVISFDNLSDAGYPYPDIEPWAGKFVQKHGWSHLGVYAQTASWFRDRDLVDFLVKLRDDGFFQRFENVALIGTSMGGFAALTFAELAPGATVVALSPQTTLRDDLVPWEKRFRKGKAQDWTLPFSDAAENLSDVGRAYVLFDPFFRPDKQQVERLPQERLITLKGFGFGHKSAVFLRRLDVLQPVMKAAIEGTLEPEEFYRLIRSRKDLYIYRTCMEAHLLERSQEDRMMKFRKAFRVRRRASS